MRDYNHVRPHSTLEYRTPMEFGGAMITFKCPKCHKQYQVADEVGGRVTRCPRCAQQLVIPVVAKRGDIPPVRLPTAPKVVTSDDPSARPIRKTPPQVQEAKPAHPPVQREPSPPPNPDVLSEHQSVYGSGRAPDLDHSNRPGLVYAMVGVVGGCLLTVCFFCGLGVFWVMTTSGGKEHAENHQTTSRREPHETMKQGTPLKPEEKKESEEERLNKELTKRRAKEQRDAEEKNARRERAIRRVLDADASSSPDPNKVRVLAYANAIRSYCTKCEQLDLQECPADFQVAVRQHWRAWRKYARAWDETLGTKEAMAMMAVLSYVTEGILKDWEKQPASAFMRDFRERLGKSEVQDVEMTWRNVEEVAARYGVVK